jgi:predicted SnoaL-like aldol condensation-catalyzing enzyme
MIEIVDTNDRNAVRNMNNIVELHEVMINQRRPEEAVAKFLDPGYIQHDPLLATGAEGLAKFFGEVLNDRPRARWVGHRIIAMGDYVWVHSNFLNIFNDDPSDTGIAGIDIFKMDADGRAIEHWEALQLVGTPENSAPWLGPNIPRANTNGIL